MEEVKYIPGDLVMYGDKVTTIRECRGNYYVLNYQKKPLEDSAYYSDLKPISLTSEILAKNGWEKKTSQNTTWYKYYTGKAYLYICKDSYIGKSWLVCVGSDKHYIANIEYVHQLQHLLFGLSLPMDLKV